MESQDAADSVLNKNFDHSVRNIIVNKSKHHSKPLSICFLLQYQCQINSHSCLRVVNPLNPMSDQDRISPYYINTVSTK